MNLRDINRLLESLSKSHGGAINMSDIQRLGRHFNEQNMTDERQLRALIQQLSSALGKQLSEEQIRNIIGLVKRNKETLKNPEKAKNLFKKF